MTISDRGCAHHGGGDLLAGDVIGTEGAQTDAGDPLAFRKNAEGNEGRIYAVGCSRKVRKVHGIISGMGSAQDSLGIIRPISAVELEKHRGIGQSHGRLEDEDVE